MQTWAGTGLEARARPLSLPEGGGDKGDYPNHRAPEGAKPPSPRAKGCRGLPQARTPQRAERSTKGARSSSPLPLTRVVLHALSSCTHARAPETRRRERSGEDPDLCSVLPLAASPDHKQRKGGAGASLAARQPWMDTVSLPSGDTTRVAHCPGQALAGASAPGEEG